MCQYRGLPISFDNYSIYYSYKFSEVLFLGWRQLSEVKFTIHYNIQYKYAIHYELLKLIVHIPQHSNNLDYIYKYKYFNKKFSNRGNLNTHELINNQGQSVPQIVSHPSSELELRSNFQLISCPNSYPSPHTVNTKYIYIWNYRYCPSEWAVIIFNSDITFYFM